LGSHASTYLAPDRKLLTQLSRVEVPAPVPWDELDTLAQPGCAYATAIPTAQFQRT